MIRSLHMCREFSVSRFVALSVFAGVVLSSSFGQEVISPSGALESYSFVVTSKDTTHNLPHEFVVEGSDSVLLDSLSVLTRDKDYSLDYRFGILRFPQGRIQGILRDSTRSLHKIFVTYKRYPFQFRERYFHREMLVQHDTARGDTIRIKKAEPPLTIGQIFGPNLQKSGSIVRGIDFGTNRDVSLTSGFRMQLSGKIASDIEIVAALTDENAPIQPEGNTQTLQEIDKVSVEIKSPNVGGTIGDFNYSSDGTEFGRIDRKLQGAMGIGNYQIGSSQGSTLVLGAVTRGKFNTAQFQGIEGVQGPYQLLGKNGEIAIIVVAGTERVYVDGERMTRGETNDYIIDYASAQVTFQPRRLITSASRIVVDFEYTDRFYSRSLFGAQMGSELGTKNVKLTAAYYRESDNQNATIDISLSDSDKAILSRSGGDRTKASKTGVTFVGRDSLTHLGKGQYVQLDTTIAQQPYAYYRYAPGDAAAVYSVIFSFVGAGQGDYLKQSIGNYQWVGVKAGSYLPIQFLPFPELHDLADVHLQAAVTSFLKLNGELAFSDFNANRFSNLPDASSKGSALNFTLAATPKDIRIGDHNFGSLDLELKNRFVGRSFVPIDRTNDIEFGREWNLESNVNQDEQIREGRISYQPLQGLKFGGGLGHIERGDLFSSDRGEFLFSLSGEKLPHVDYTFESIRSHDSTIDNAADWKRQHGVVTYRVAGILPGFRFDGEDKQAHTLLTDSLTLGSFRYNEFAPRLEIPDFHGMAFRSEFQFRSEDSLSQGVLQKASESFSQTYQWQLKDWKNLSSTVDLTVRNKDFTEEFKRRGNSNIQTLLMRARARYSPLARALDADLFYEVQTQRSSRPERVFVRVPKGTGNYRYLGDLDGNGIADENEYELTRFDGDYVVVTVPTDELYPVIDLKSSSRIRLTPARLVEPSASFIAEAIRSFSTETYLRVEERSTERDLKEIYLLRLSRFQNDSTTIVGTKQLTQDLYLFENDPDLSLRFRFGERSGFTQFAFANERSLTLERSVRVRGRLVKEIAAQFDVIQKIDRVTATRPTNRERNITSNTLSSDLSYRPEQNVEVGFRFDVTRATDSFPIRPLTADINDQNIRLVYSLETKGQVRAEVEREEVILDGTAVTLPFELTGGKLAGKSWLWHVNLDYRVADFVQATVGYDGRSEGGRPALHLARAEVRAFF
jgi:hypothetical protein